MTTEVKTATWGPGDFRPGQVYDLEYKVKGPRERIKDKDKVRRLYTRVAQQHPAQRVSKVMAAGIEVEDSDGNKHKVNYKDIVRVQPSSEATFTLARASTLVLPATASILSPRAPKSVRPLVSPKAVRSPAPVSPSAVIGAPYQSPPSPVFPTGPPPGSPLADLAPYQAPSEPVFPTGPVPGSPLGATTPLSPLAIADLDFSLPSESKDTSEMKKLSESEILELNLEELSRPRQGTVSGRILRPSSLPVQWFPTGVWGGMVRIVGNSRIYRTVETPEWLQPILLRIEQEQSQPSASASASSASITSADEWLRSFPSYPGLFPHSNFDQDIRFATDFANATLTTMAATLAAIDNQGGVNGLPLTEKLPSGWAFPTLVVDGAYHDEISFQQIQQLVNDPKSPPFLFGDHKLLYRNLDGDHVRILGDLDGELHHIFKTEFRKWNDRNDMTITFVNPVCARLDKSGIIIQGDREVYNPVALLTFLIQLVQNMADQKRLDRGFEFAPCPDLSIGVYASLQMSRFLPRAQPNGSVSGSRHH